MPLLSQERPRKSSSGCAISGDSVRTKCVTMMLHNTSFMESFQSMFRIGWLMNSCNQKYPPEIWWEFTTILYAHSHKTKDVYCYLLEEISKGFSHHSRQRIASYLFLFLLHSKQVNLPVEEHLSTASPHI